jgi:hypothetical protein
MKVFLSHTNTDKPIVDQFAFVLRNALGQDNVFYDSWSIQPGDGIIDKMNQGLFVCDLFFFFVSKNSLTSKMVEMEWQNALMAEAKKAIRFIPVKIDDCSMPSILQQKVYIDAYHEGIDVAIRQVIDVINSDSSRRDSEDIFHNLRAFAIPDMDHHRMDFVIRAMSFIEPISRYLIALDSDAARLYCTSDSMTMTGKGGTIQNPDGKKLYLYSIGVNRSTTPGFPFRLSVVDEKAINISGVFHAKSEDEFENVPITVVLPDSIFHLGGDVELELNEVIGDGKDQLELIKYLEQQIQKANKPH